MEWLFIIGALVVAVYVPWQTINIMSELSAIRRKQEDHSQAIQSLYEFIRDLHEKVNEANRTLERLDDDTTDPYRRRFQAP